MKRTIFIFAILALMVIGSEANAYEKNHNCEKNPIYCQIVNNKPTIKRAYAFKLSNIISKKTRKHKVDPVIFTAILAQESMYRVSAKNCTTGIELTPKDQEYIHYTFNKCLTIAEIGSKKFTECVHKGTNYSKNKKVKVCTDFGIGQIWYKTAESYEFDIEKLTTDIDYSVEAAITVLKDFKNRYGHKESDWWTRYNASSKDARAKYKDLVERFTSAN